MIIEFKIANFRSIHEEQTFSFVAENARRHPNNLIARKGYKLLKAAALFGANASGKSNVVKALGVMQSLVRDSATRMNDGDLIPGIDPFRLDPESRTEPSRFEITFLTDDKVYTYGFAADSHLVYHEHLSVRPENARAKTLLFERDVRPKVGVGVFKTIEMAERDRTLVNERTRNNALMLSTGAQENVQELLPVYRYIRNMIRVLDMSVGIGFLGLHAAEQCAKDERLRQKIETLLCDADTGISSLHVETGHKLTMPNIREGGPPEIQSFFKAVVGLVGEATVNKIVSHHKGTDGNNVRFDFEEDDSQGTNRLFALAVLFINALETGSSLAIDELGASMHPLLTRKLLELFQSPDSNPNGAQLLFTTHDTSLFNQNLFRLDQLWLAEKRNGASEFFPLSDIEPRPRDTRLFLKNYLSGRYGGTPRLGRTFEDLQLGDGK